MTDQFAKFGELTLAKSSSIDDENDNSADGFANGFSTIDLNAGVQTPNFNNTMNSSYTSFGEAIQTFNHLPSQSENVISSNVHQTTMQSSNSFNSSLNSPSGSIISSASDVSNRLANKTASTFETLKQWSKSAYKCTRQIVSEKLGKSSRTIDPELDGIIENIRETRRKYDQLLFLSRALAHHYYNIVTTQKMLADSFSTLSQKSPELLEEFTSNCETQRNLVKNGEILLTAINSFTSTLNTLCTKTMEDTLQTVRNYEGARLEYDAYRFDMETLHNSSQTDQKNQQIQDLEKDLQMYKEKYEKLKSDVIIKTKFLDENRVKVMRKQLILLQNATSAYYSNNSTALETTMKQFNISNKLSQSSTSSEDLTYKSFLEQKL